MEQKWKEIYENIIFMVAMLAGIDSILSIKVCMMTGQMVYWFLGIACFIVMMKCVCRKPTTDSES